MQGEPSRRPASLELAVTGDAQVANAIEQLGRFDDMVDNPGIGTWDVGGGNDLRYSRLVCDINAFDLLRRGRPEVSRTRQQEKDIMSTYLADKVEDLTVQGPSARFTYRRMGPQGGIPLVLLNRFRGTIETRSSWTSWPPATTCP